MAIRQSFFAWAINHVMKVYEPKIAPFKEELFGDLTGEILEIGPGTGVNLKYLNPQVHWTGLDPNPHMNPYIQKEATKLGFKNANFIQGSALEIPLSDNSIDTIIGSLVLCSVPNPQQTLQELHRVLKPGGKYLFIEHVAAQASRRKKLTQQVIKPLWCCCADGCHVDRPTWKTIAESPFPNTDIRHFDLPFPVVSPHIMGQAIKT